MKLHDDGYVGDNTILHESALVGLTKNELGFVLSSTKHKISDVTELNSFNTTSDQLSNNQNQSRNE